MTSSTPDARRPLGAVLALSFPSSGARRLAAWTLTLAVLILAGFAAAPSAHAADRAFTPRFSTNDTGDIDIVGNTSLTCPTSATGCVASRNSGPTTTASSALTNNAYNMEYVDVDGDSSTFNSSRSTVTLPTGSTVLFAGLYWTGRTAAGSGGHAAPSSGLRNTVKLKAPKASSYESITGTFDEGSEGIYQGFADVTSRVKAAGAGVYTVADIQAATGSDTLAGWSLVVAYRDTTEPARNLTVFDGLKTISSGGSGTISVSGFKTPPKGDVHTTVGFVAYEGDAGYVGDSATLNGKTLSDAQHPATNFFDSRISRGGKLIDGRDPSYANNLGIDIAMLEVGSDYISNSATSATIGLSTASDVYAPGVVTFATELYAPKVEQTKTVADDNGGVVEQGDTLTYTISGKNNGQDGATGFVLRDPLPANVAYVPGSLTLAQKADDKAVTPTTTTTPTDAADSDIGEYDAANRRLVARLGTGASGTTGGTLAVGGSYTATFKVKVGGPSPGVASGTTIANTATASFASQSLGTALTAESTATTTVRSPDLTIAKTGAGPITRGGTRSYAVDVKNDGDAKTQGTVTVSDDLPTGLTAKSASGTGWNCAPTPAKVTCTRSDALAAGDSYPTITIVTDVANDAPLTVANSATVAGGGDGDLSNNSSTDTSQPQSITDLGLEKSADVTSPAVGDAVVYALKVTNSGSSPSTGSTVTDTLPAGLTFVSSPDCTGSAAASTVTCAVGPLARGASVTVHLTAKAAVGTAGTKLRNAASVAGNEPEPASGTLSNDAAASVAVKPVDLVVTNAIKDAPSSLDAGGTYTWQVDVRNAGTSPASGSTVSFPVPKGTTVAAGLDARCTQAADQITCDLGTVAPGASASTISIPLKVASGTDAPASVATIATAKSLETDANIGDNSAATSTPVKSAVDLSVTLKPTPTSTSAGDALKLTATVQNAGPASPVAPKLVVPIPDGTTFVSADPGCVLGVDDNGKPVVTCTLSSADLGPGKSLDRVVTVKVGAAPGDVITATATVSTTSNDTDLSNNEAELIVPVVKVAGLSITKTASTGQAKPGETVTYTLTAANAGPAGAQDTVVTDTLPSGTTFVSADAPCTYDRASGSVSCDLGTVASGQSRAVKVVVTVDQISNNLDVNVAHQIDVTKIETDLAMEAGQTGTATATCPSGYVATDGSVRLVDTEQGRGTLADARVLSSGATADGTGWTGTVRNDSTGRLQAKVNVVCIGRTLAAVNGHTHSLLVSDPVAANRTLTAGTYEVALTCGTGRVAVAPGWSFASGDGRVRVSQAQGNGWRFVVDVPEAADASFAVRCMSTTTSIANGHAHDLQLSRMTDTVDVAAGSRTSKSLTCANDGKGIVASTDVDGGLTPLGNDPQPVTRVFGFQNTTSGTLSARVGLLCIGTRTSGELAVHDVANTAAVTTSTANASTAEVSSTATFRATAASGPVAETPTTATTPAPAAAGQSTAAAPAPTSTTPSATTTSKASAAATPKASILASKLRVTGSGSAVSVSVPVSCTATCTARVRLTALKAIPGTKVRAGTVLASASTTLVRGRKGNVRVVARGAAARALKRGRVTRARLAVTTGNGTTVTRTVRIVLR